jgi:hypothetical protein
MPDDEGVKFEKQPWVNESRTGTKNSEGQEIYQIHSSAYRYETLGGVMGSAERRWKGSTFQFEPNGKFSELGLKHFRAETMKDLKDELNLWVSEKVFQHRKKNIHEVEFNDLEDLTGPAPQRRSVVGRMAL